MSPTVAVTVHDTGTVFMTFTLSALFVISEILGYCIAQRIALRSTVISCPSSVSDMGIRMFSRMEKIL
jgi:hypothetical protein